MFTHILDTAIDEVDIVSFDIFDTLIKRNVEDPADVFDLVELDVHSKTGIECKNFRRLRIESEKKARKTSSGEEVSIIDIYKVLASSMPNWPISALLQSEQEVEVNIASPNRDVLAFYKECVNRGKTIIATSDMYLDAPTIRRILAKCGYERIHSLYVSSELDKRKSTGSLFKYILGVHNIEPARLLHLGDNKASDVDVPRRLGCNAVQIKDETNLVLPYHQAEMKNSVLQAYLKNTAEAGDYFYEVGRETLGPTLLGLCEGLHQYIDSISPDIVVFLSRDGAIIQRAYEALYGASANHRYAYCSRRGIIVPTLCRDCSIESIQHRIHFKREMTVKDVLDRIGLDAKQYTNEIEKTGLTSDTIVNGTKLGNDESFVQLFSMLREDILANSSREYEGARDYWTDIVGGARKVVVVDIGWNGNMQRALEAIFSEIYEANAPEIFGYYLGVNPWATYNGHMKGFLFNRGDNSDDMKLANRIRYFISIIELMFMANHGSLKRYERDGQICLYQYEYGSTSAHSVATEQAIMAMQNGAVAMIEEYGHSWLKEMSPITKDNVIDALFSLGEHPTYESAAQFGDCLFLNTNLEYIARSANGHFKTSEFKGSSWRVGYLRRYLHANFPLHRTVSLMMLASRLNGSRK